MLRDAVLERVSKARFREAKLPATPPKWRVTDATRITLIEQIVGGAVKV